MSIEPALSPAPELTAVKPAPRSLSPITDADPAFDERWAAWQARGAEHDRVTARRMLVIAPILMLIAGLVAFIFSR